MTSEPSRTYRYVTPESDVEHVASTRIFDLRWATNSKTLFYTTSGKNWAYDVVSGSSMEVSLEELLQLTPKPEILSQLPSEAVGINIAPSGDRALFFILSQVSDTEVQMPKTDVVEIWLHERGRNSVKLGETEFCGFDEALWTPDETKIIIPRGPTIDRCGETYAWLADLKTMTLVSLFPYEDYPVAVDSYGLSPNGRNLLFGTFGIYKDDQLTNPLYSLNTNNLSIEQLETPDMARGEQWITNHEILISYEKSPQTQVTLGIFDLESSEVIELTPMFNELCVRFPSVSPDLRWLAFATGEDCDHMNDLWLISLL